MSSPRSRKRQRMSSPTYDEQVVLSQDVIDAFDKFEHARSRLHSSEPHSPSKMKPSTSLSGREKRQREIAEALRGPGSGKENLWARGQGWSAPASPANDVLSPQSSLNVGQDDDIENPFTVSNTGLSYSFHIYLTRF
jgi:hypothetical protein